MRNIVFNIISVLVIFIAPNVGYSQEISIGNWRAHESFSNAFSVCDGNDRIYCATASGTFSYNISDGSFSKLSKSDGFSDMGVSTIGYNKHNGILLVAYKNSNIDLVKKGRIINVSDLKRKTILGNKNINSISFVGPYAYLSCGFGIVVLDTEKEEVKDTYYIGPNGSSINVYETVTDGQTIMAATESGIYQASYNNPHLANYSSWNKHSDLPDGIYNSIAIHGGKFYASLSMKLTGDAWMADTIYEHDGTGWKKMPNYSPNVVKKIRSCENSLVVSQVYDVLIYDIYGNLKDAVSKYGFADANPSDCLLKNGTLWVADNLRGLIKTTGNYNGEKIIPNGPASGSSFRLRLLDNRLWMAPGVINGYNSDDISMFENGEWSVVTSENNPGMDSIVNIIDIAIDPNDKDSIYVSTFGMGMYIFYKDKLVGVYKENNSSLTKLPHDPKYYSLRPVQTVFDNDHNMWVALSEVPSPLSVRKANKKWQAFDFTGYVTKDTKVRKLIVTTSGQVWLTLPEEGLLIYNITYDSNGDYSQPTAGNTRKAGMTEGQGNLPSKNVYAVAEDKDGEVWVGTGAGIVVFYSPDNIFQPGMNWDAQQVLIEQDGHVQVLLETEVVTDIKIDGANRKWIATQNSGVYLMSADGASQIYHFNKDNSPLPSNEVLDICLNPDNGEVFFATSSGLVSFKSTATEGAEDFSGAYAYPNPVRPGYSGTIAIKGLMQDSDVKITDIAGNLVWHTKALGGQAIWDGKNFSGQKVATGVYLVMSNNSDGSFSNVTKILFFN